MGKTVWEEQSSVTLTINRVVLRRAMQTVKFEVIVSFLLLIDDDDDA